MQFDVITIFPKILDSYVNESIIGRALKEKIIKIKFHDLRKWTTDKRHTVDDAPFGGGAGMILKPEPIYKSLKELKALKKESASNITRQRDVRTILLSARGVQFTQAKAIELLKYKRIVFVCGRYEGVDNRVSEYMVDEEISVGPYVLTGGEIPAMIIIDAVSRLISGVLGNKASLTEESYTINNSKKEDCYKEYPQYTRPTVFSPNRDVKWKVPDVLLSGDHKKIQEWRKKNSC